MISLVGGGPSSEYLFSSRKFGSLGSSSGGVESSNFDSRMDSSLRSFWVVDLSQLFSF
jgi:hypothetical protein